MEEQKESHGGDKFLKYKEKRRAMGKLALPDSRLDLAIFLLANGVATQETILDLAKITPEELQTLLVDPVAQNRLKYLRKQNVQPRDEEDYKRAALVGLHKVAKRSEDDRVKISAFKELGTLAHRYQQDSPAPTENRPQIEDDILDRLGGGGE